MELTHTFTVAAPIEVTWAALNDIESVAGCFPGAAITSTDGDSFTGTCKVKLGPIALVYNGSGAFVEKEQTAHSMKIDAKGKDKRGNGTAGAKISATLSDMGGQTRVQVVTDLAITGRPAQFGRGVMQDVSDKLLGQFVTCLQDKIGVAASTEPEDASPGQVSSGGVDASTEALPTPGTTATPATAQTAHSSPAPHSIPLASSPRPTPADDDALDLGGAVLPILAKTYWKQALGAAAVVGVIVYVATR